MMLIEETPIPDAALPVEAFKAHLRLGSGFGPGDVQDAVLLSFMRAAIAAVEGRTNKVLLERGFAQTVTQWRSTLGHVLPLAPVVALTQIERVDHLGMRTDIDLAGFWLERDSHTPRVRPAGTALPQVPAGGSIVAHFNAGFAADWDGIPSDLRQAVLMLAAHYYEYRHDTGLSDGCTPFGVSSLIERYKAVRIGAGALR